MLHRSTVLAASVVLALFAPQQQPPVFRGARETVLVPATVFDRYGDLVTTLGRDDFAVRDDGKVQEITNFSSGLQPITAAVLVDTSLSMTLAIERARAAAEVFVDRLRPDDKAIVGTFNSRVSLDPHFTGDRDQLGRLLHADTSFGNPTRLFDAIDAAFDALVAQDGRRVVVVFTDGCDTQSTVSWPALHARALAEDIMIYAVQFRTRIPTEPGVRFRSDCELHMRTELPVSASIGDILRTYDPDRIVSSALVLSDLTRDTGGDRLFLSNLEDINATFTRIMTELHYQYLIGFSPTKKDGKLHVLSVSVKDRTMTVRTRRSYQAPIGRG